MPENKVFHNHNLHHIITSKLITFREEKSDIVRKSGGLLKPNFFFQSKVWTCIQRWGVGGPCQKYFFCKKFVCEAWEQFLARATEGTSLYVQVRQLVSQSVSQLVSQLVSQCVSIFQTSHQANSRLCREMRTGQSIHNLSFACFFCQDFSDFYVCMYRKV